MLEKCHCNRTVSPQPDQEPAETERPPPLCHLTSQTLSFKVAREYDSMTSAYSHLVPTSVYVRESGRSGSLEDEGGTGVVSPRPAGCGRRKTSKSNELWRNRTKWLKSWIVQQLAGGSVSFSSLPQPVRANISYCPTG